MAEAQTRAPIPRACARIIIVSECNRRTPMKAQLQNPQNGLRGPTPPPTPQKRVIPAALKKYGLIVALSFAALALATTAHTVPHLVLEAGIVVAIAMLALGWPLLQPVSHTKMSALIAFIGCDGSGKSTLSQDMLKTVSCKRPAATCYLGLGSGEMGNRIKRLPVIGAAIERRLSQKATQTRNKDSKIPGPVTALVIYTFSLMRLRRFRKMLALREAGVIVLTDRYPQTDVAGFYDGPGLSAARAEGWFVSLLARKEREMYDWMASHRPDVVIRLNVDPATAHSRKPDHDFDLLARKVQATAKLRFGGAPIIDIDSTQPYPEVRSAVAWVVSTTLQKKEPNQLGLVA